MLLNCQFNTNLINKHYPDISIRSSFHYLLKYNQVKTSKRYSELGYQVSVKKISIFIEN